MARRPRVTKLVGRFTIEPGDMRVEQRPFVQNNGDGTFSFSTGKEGIKFSLSDTELLDLITDRKKRRIVLEENPEPPAPVSKPKRKQRAAGGAAKQD
ncbi:MAG: hypothetical protein K2V38_23065 [Gemmataceae bacterium]|nr:hypothetical protein [Gemmataceae bacterium]